MLDRPPADDAHEPAGLVGYGNAEGRAPREPIVQLVLWLFEVSCSHFSPAAKIRSLPVMRAGGKITEQTVIIMATCCPDEAEPGPDAGDTISASIHGPGRLGETQAAVTNPIQSNGAHFLFREAIRCSPMSLISVVFSGRCLVSNLLQCRLGSEMDGAVGLPDGLL